MASQMRFRWARKITAIIVTFCFAYFIINETGRDIIQNVVVSAIYKDRNWKIKQFLQNLSSTPLNKTESKALKSNYDKVILLWTKFFQQDDFHFGYGSNPFIKKGCREKRCEVTKDRDRLKEADAVIFHGVNMLTKKKSASLVKGFDFPPFKPKGQRWIFLNRESPSLTWILNPAGKKTVANVLGPVFNLSMTYRLDSDIPIPYGFKIKRESSKVITKKVNYSANKTKLAAWFVSNCHTPSKREKYVDELRRYIPVDIYGECSSKKCSRKRNGDCESMLTRDYKFYLSFENSLCRDYSSEKMWKILARTTAVPVVLNGANLTAQAPPGSYIDALKFSPKELAKYLKDMDDKRYNEYHAWRKYYDIRIESVVEGFCRLCDYMHRQNDQVAKWYEKLSDFWSEERDCYPQLITWD